MADDNKIIAELVVAGKDKFVSDLLAASKAADSTSVSVAKMEATLKDIPAGTKEFEKLKNEIEATKIVAEEANGAFENNRRKLAELKKETSGLATIMATLKSEGKQNTETFKQIQQRFEETKKKAGELQDKISDINDEIKNLGSDTRGIDNAVRGVTLIANGFQLAQGATAVFGKENKNLEQALIKLNGVMAITQSIQAIGTELTKEDSIVKQAAAKATQLFNFVVGESTGVLRLFRLALLGTGIGAAVFVIYELTKGWFGLGEEVGKVTEKQKDYNDVIKEGIELSKQRLQEESTGFKRQGNLYLQDGTLRKKTLEQQLKDALAIQEQWRQRTEFASSDSSKNFEEYLKKNSQAIIEADREVESIQKAIKDRDDKAAADKAAKEKAAREKMLKDRKADIERFNYELQSIESFDKNSEKAIKAQIDWYTQLKSVVDINSESYTDLITIIDLLQKKLAGKQKIEPIDFQSAMSGLKPKDILPEGKTLWEIIFGTPSERIDDQKRMLKDAQGTKKIVDELINYGQQISNIASQAIDIQTQNQLSSLEERKNKGLISEKEYERESAKIKNEAARKKRAIDIANAVAQIPQAVLSAYIAGLQIGGPAAPIIAGVLAGIAGAFGAAQVALIAAAPLPKFRKGGSVAKRLGLIQGARHEQGGVPIEVEGGEFVMNTKAVKTYGVKLMDDINSLRFNPVLAGNNIRKGSNNRLNEQLATIGSYLRDGYRVDRQGNQILQEISSKLGKQKGYV